MIDWAAIYQVASEPSYPSQDDCNCDRTFVRIGREANWMGRL